MFNAGDLYNLIDLFSETLTFTRLQHLQQRHVLTFYIFLSMLRYKFKMVSTVGTQPHDCLAMNILSALTASS